MVFQSERLNRMAVAIVAAFMTSLALPLIAVVPLVLVTHNPQQTLPDFVTLPSCAALGVFLYLGASWARWAAGCLCALGGVTLVLAGGELGALASAVALAAAATLLAAAYGLMFAPPVRACLEGRGAPSSRAN